MSAVEVDVSKRCPHGTFTITLGSNSQWHLPGAGTFSSEAGEWWVFHNSDEICECWTEEE